MQFTIVFKTSFNKVNTHERMEFAHGKPGRQLIVGSVVQLYALHAGLQ